MMIEINLLPEELKAKKAKIAKVKAKTDSTDIKSLKKSLYAVPVIIVIFLIVHIYLAMATIGKNIEVSSLSRQKQKLEPEKQKLEEFRSGYLSSSSDMQILQREVSSRIIWAQKLNSLSNNLPNGAWLNEITITDKALVLRGSVVSSKKDEINLVNRYIDNLNKDKSFISDFDSLELGTISRRSIQNLEIMDFELSGKLKGR